MDTPSYYRKRFAQLKARYCHAHGCWNWDEFVTWITDLRPNLRPSTYRLYRAAIDQAIRDEHVANGPELSARMRAPIQRSTNMALRTSARKAKSLSQDDWLCLLRWLMDTPGRWNVAAARWLAWGVLTGLRPIEWRRAVLSADHSNETGVMLHVQNAKCSHDRAHGPRRTLHLNLRQEDIQDLAEFMRTVQSSYAEAYEGCRRAVWRAAGVLWPNRRRRPSLYSSRHQFAANAKAAGLLPEEIAAVMGHAITGTHQCHYGKRRCGHAGMVAVQADPSDVARVLARIGTNERPDVRAAM